MTNKQRDGIQNRLADCSYRRSSDGRGEEKRYWVLKGKLGCFYTCARFHDVRYTALCVFDSREAAVEQIESLDENRLFLSTLELYGPSMPTCVRRGPLLPELRKVSGEELWKIIETVGVGYVTLNPPPAERKASAFELHPVGIFNPV